VSANRSASRRSARKATRPHPKAATVLSGALCRPSGKVTTDPGGRGRRARAAAGRPAPPPPGSGPPSRAAPGHSRRSSLAALSASTPSACLKQLGRGQRAGRLVNIKCSFRLLDGAAPPLVLEEAPHALELPPSDCGARGRRGARGEGGRARAAAGVWSRSPAARGGGRRPWEHGRAASAGLHARRKTEPFALRQDQVRPPHPPPLAPAPAAAPAAAAPVSHGVFRFTQRTYRRTKYHKCTHTPHTALRSDVQFAAHMAALLCRSCSRAARMPSCSRLGAPWTHRATRRPGAQTPRALPARAGPPVQLVDALQRIGGLPK
jgi:hypothetical protein